MNTLIFQTGCRCGHLCISQLNVDVFIVILRCVPGALPADAGSAGDPAATHGADARPVSEEGPRHGPDQSLSPAERLISSLMQINAVYRLSDPYTVDAISLSLIMIR